MLDIFLTMLASHNVNMQLLNSNNNVQYKSETIKDKNEESKKTLNHHHLMN